MMANRVEKVQENLSYCYRPKKIATSVQNSEQPKHDQENFVFKVPKVPEKPRGVKFISFWEIPANHEKLKNIERHSSRQPLKYQEAYRKSMTSNKRTNVLPKHHQPFCSSVKVEKRRKQLSEQPSCSLNNESEPASKKNATSEEKGCPTLKMETMKNKQGDFYVKGVNGRKDQKSRSNVKMETMKNKAGNFHVEKVIRKKEGKSNSNVKMETLKNKAGNFSVEKVIGRKEGKNRSKVKMETMKNKAGDFCVEKIIGRKEGKNRSNVKIETMKNKAGDFCAEKVIGRKEEKGRSNVKMETMTNKAGDFYVEKVIGWKKEMGLIFFYVKWVGYPDYDNTWEPAQHLQNCRELLVEFWKEEQLKEQIVNAPIKKENKICNSIYNGAEGYRTNLQGIENLHLKLSCDYYPMRLIHVTNINGEIFYVVQWKDLWDSICKKEDGKITASNTSIVSGEQFRQKFPQIVIDFYESRFLL